MTIGEKIRELRREAGITQEALAERLRVSYQAVSKWETNAALPDIGLIVPIAEFFGVTTDTLFGLDGKSQAEEVKKIEEESARLAMCEKYGEQFALWRDAAEKYPNNLRCLAYFSRMLHRESKNKERCAEERANMGMRAIELAKRAARDSTDTFLKYSSIQILVLEYGDETKPYHDEKKAAEYAASAASFWVCREVLLPHALSGSAARRANENNVILFAVKLCAILESLGKGSKAGEIQALESCLEIWKAIFYDENYLAYHQKIWKINMRLAELYAETKRKDKAFEHLEKARFHAEKCDAFKGGEMYTSIFTDMLSGEKSFGGDAVKEFTKRSGSGIFEFERKP